MIYDICIVGSGAGGAPVAYELANAGYSVIVLEKGKNYTEADFSKDEVAVCRRELFTPPLSEQKHIINEYSASGNFTRYDGEASGWNFWNGSMVGGSSNLMSGYFHRMKPNDFALRSVYGEIKGANVVDWPISYDELEPYYEKVERIIGVSGKVKQHTYQEPRSTSDFPYPPLKTSGVTKWFDAACENLNIEFFETPRAILSQNSLQREACYYSNLCGSYGCSSGAKGSARAALLQKCSAKIVTDAFVYKLQERDGYVTKAYYYTKNRMKHVVNAKMFVLAAQAIETSRLLLNSKSKAFPNGLANNSGQVGKNLIFSAGGAGSGRFTFDTLTPEQQSELMEPGVFFNRSLQGEYDYDDGCHKYKGGTIDFLFEHQNIISRAQQEIYDENGNLLWGDALKKKIHERLTRSRVLTFEIFNDWLPTDDCYVSVEDATKDIYGLPVGVININSHPHDLAVAEHLAQDAVAILEEMGAVEIDYSISSSPPPNLVAGGCRFGNDPQKSVLDKNCKAHELHNLYVTDGSFMPTGGSVPFTWTIYANAFRVADLIKEQFESSFKNLN